jgi:hypothetical protein
LGQRTEAAAGYSNFPYGDARRIGRRYQAQAKTIFRSTCFPLPETITLEHGGCMARQRFPCVPLMEMSSPPEGNLLAIAEVMTELRFADPGLFTFLQENKP